MHMSLEKREEESPSLVGTQNLRRIQRTLLDDRSFLIVVCGMAGVGKTALMKAAAASVAGEFDLIVWVTVRHPLDVRTIQEDIARQLCLSFRRGASEGERRSALFDALREPKFLLVLDDCWSGWSILHIFGSSSIPFSDRHRESRAVVITRYPESRNRSGITIRVGFLGAEESWELFRREVGRDVDIDHPSIKPLAETVVGKCGGLPLALIEVARAMAHASTASEWVRAIKIHNEPAGRLSLPGMDGCVRTLKSAHFDRLADEETRQCLLSCCLFPEDHSIGHDQLRDLWVAKGLGPDEDSSSSATAGFFEFIMDPLSCLLIWDGYRRVKVHSTVRLMAYWLISDDSRYSRMPGLSLLHKGRGRLKYVTGQDEAWSEAKRFLLMYQEMGEGCLADDTPHHFPHLRTLLLPNRKCSPLFLRNLFLRTPALDFLNLSDATVVGGLLPAEIGSLGKLQNLDLSGTAIEQLPAEIGRLVNLRYLNLSRTGITGLPATLCELVKLTHLHLRQTRRLSSFPPGKIEGLRTLDLFQSTFLGINLRDLPVCFPSIATLGLSLHDEDGLEALANPDLPGGLHKYSVLRQPARQYSVLRQPRRKYSFLKQPAHAKVINPLRFLELSNIAGLNTKRLSAALHNLWGLRELSIVGPCPKSPELELESLQDSLQVLHLSCLQQTQTVKAHLYSLCELHIDNCHGFRDLTCFADCKKLEYILLADCNGLEVLLVPGPKLKVTNLRKISLCRLPRLRSISGDDLLVGNLEELEVRECPNLTKLPFDEATAITMKRIVGEQEWWDKLDFSSDRRIDDKLIKHEGTLKVARSHCFRPFPSSPGQTGKGLPHKFESSSSLERSKEKPHEGVGSPRKKGKEKLEEIQSILPEEGGELVSGEEFSSDVADREEADPIIHSLVGDELAPPPEELDNLVYVEGQEKILSTILEHLQNDGVGVIGIQGVDGVGKTTLLKRLKNELCSKQDSVFDVVIMVTASKNFHHKKKIQKKIGEQLGLSLLACGPSFLEDMQATVLRQALSHKKFLLIIDGAQEMAWDKIGIPLLDRIHWHKIILSTDVCKDMKDVEIIKMESLNDFESWQLFSRKVQDEAIIENQNIKPLAKQVVAKCHGLPLALITVGRAMTSKKAEHDWQNAIEKLDGLAEGLQDGEQTVHHALKFSYHFLQDDTLRFCLLYCCLFPENHNIGSKELIQYWFGEGLLHDSDIDSAHNVGHMVIKQLKAASLLEDGSDKEHAVKLHNAVREFMLQLTSSAHEQSNIFRVHSGRGLTQAPAVEEWRWATRISLMYNEMEILPSKIPKCPKLSTLLLNKNASLKQIPKGFFRYMPALCVLDLSYTGIEKLPKALGLLSKLQFLSLSHTNISSMPKELENLVQLSQLDLSYMPSLTNIPQKAILKLSKLQMLNLYNTSQWYNQELGYWKKGARIPDLKNLVLLKDLRLTIKSSICLLELQNNSKILSIMRSLGLIELEGLTDSLISDILGRLEKLEVLKISDAPQLEKLQFTHDQLQSLEVISLEHLPLATFTVHKPVEHLPLRKLCRLIIIGCHGFKDLNWIRLLPSLEYIELRVCYELKEIATGDGVEEEIMKNCSFPRLKIMHLWDLPKLERISKSSLCLPFLEYLKVFHCPRLMKLPLTAESAKKIKEICGHREWWDGLEWDHQSVKACFLKHFKDPRNREDVTGRLRLMGSNY